MNLDFKFKIQALTRLGEMLSTASFALFQGGCTLIYISFAFLCNAV